MFGTWTWVRGTALAVALASTASAAENLQYAVINQMPYLAFDKLDATRVAVDEGTLKVAMAPGKMSVGQQPLINWVKRSGRAIGIYFGRFPVRNARVLLIPDDGAETSGGQAYGNAGAAVRIMVGREITKDALVKDWQLPHEMVHLGFPNVQKDTWLSEGMAVYVEPIARVQAGDLKAEEIWADFAKSMPTGLPKPGDKGMAETDVRERIYWGGAMFWLVAELEIRKRTDNRIGVQTALRAVRDEGGTIEKVWLSEKALAIADKATGEDVLSKLYKQWQAEPQSPDLDQIWRDLGINMSGDNVTFDDTAPLAKLRMAITAKPSSR